MNCNTHKHSDDDVQYDIRTMALSMDRSTLVAVVNELGALTGGELGGVWPVPPKVA